MTQGSHYQHNHTLSFHQAATQKVPLTQKGCVSFHIFLLCRNWETPSSSKKIQKCMWSHGYCVWTEPQPKQTHQRVTELPWDEWNMWISVCSILFTFSSHPQAPETAKSERQPGTYTPRWVFHREALLLLLLFSFMPTATLGRRAREWECTETQT